MLFAICRLLSVRTYDEALNNTINKVLLIWLNGNSLNYPEMQNDTLLWVKNKNTMIFHSLLILS